MSLVPLRSSNSVSGLHESGALLWDAILEGPVDRVCVEDVNKSSRRVLKSLQMTASLSAGVSYFPIILHSGLFYAVGNFLSFSALDFWAIQGTLDDALGARGGREVDLIKHSSKGRGYEISVAASSIALAVFSVTPIALPTLDYDGSMGVPAMIGVYAGGSIVPLRSIQLSLNERIQEMDCMVGPIGKKVLAIRKQVISLVDQYESVFVQLKMDDKLRLIREFDRIRDFDELERGTSYLEKILVGAEIQTEPDEGSRCQRFTHVARDCLVNFPGALLAASLETALTLYMFDKSHEYITDNDLGAGVCTAITVGAGLYLNGKSIVGTTSSFVRGFFGVITGQRTKGISEQLRSKLTIGLKLIGLTINIGTFGSSIVIFGDFFKNKGWEEAYFETTVCAAYFLLTATATLDLVDDAVKSIILEKGTTEEKQVVAFCQELAHLKRLFKKSSLFHFANFLSDSCPFQEQLLARVNLAHAQLSEYIGPTEVSLQSVV
jgi:hypothetical protein